MVSLFPQQSEADRRIQKRNSDSESKRNKRQTDSPGDGDQTESNRGEGDQGKQMVTKTFSADYFNFIK